MRQTRLVVCLVMLILTFPGCGKKDDPMPPQIKLPTVADLAAASRKEGIVLVWSLARPPEGIAVFKILRSETSRGIEACPGCPQDYRPFATVALADERLQREGIKGFRYVDSDVRNGSFYSYRVTVCDRADHCGEASNETGLIYTDR
jgi:hypothetical protein